MADSENVDDVQMVLDSVTDQRTQRHEGSDDMDLDRFMMKTETVALQGNISYLIVDTNFIISHLSVVDELRNLGLQYGLIVIIPSEVVWELDGLKNSTKDGRDVGKLARRANEWIYGCLAERCPTVKAQGSKQRLNKLATKDDAILDCCLYFQQNYPQTLQILLSNDRNLCSRALTEDILTISFDPAMNARVIAETVSRENILRFGTIDPKSTVAHEVEVPVPQHAANPQDVYRTVYDEIEQLVIFMVQKCMQLEYGEDLELVRDYNEARMTSLESAASTMIRFWIPVFSAPLRRLDPFGRDQKKHCPMTHRPTDAKALRSFVDYWVPILHRLYTDFMDEDQQKSLHLLAERWDGLLKQV